jgi:hypothetical protein
MPVVINFVTQISKESQNILMGGGRDILIGEGVKTFLSMDLKLRKNL